MATPFWLTRLAVRAGFARFLPAVRRHTRGEPAFARFYSDRVLAAPIDGLLDPFAFPEPAAADVLDLNLAAPRYEAAFERGNTAALTPGGTRGAIELRAAIADRLQRHHALAFDPDENIVVTRGATGAFVAALDAFVNPGDGVVLFDPGSPLFHLGARSRRARLRWVPTWSEEGCARFLVEGLARTMRGAKLLAIADPANPTGAAFGPEEWERIAWVAKRQNVLVYLDQSFAAYRYDEPTRLPADDAFRKRLLCAGSVSQPFGMTASRVGWLAGPPQLVDACRLTQALAGPIVPDACQAAALRALRAPDEMFRPTVEAFRRRRQYAFDRLKGMGIEAAWPTGGFTLWADVTPTGLTGREFAERLWREERVAVGAGDVYGPSGTNHIRVSYAAEEGRLREGLTRLAAFVGRLRGTSTAETEPIRSEPVEATDAVPAFSRV